MSPLAGWPLTRVETPLLHLLAVDPGETSGVAYLRVEIFTLSMRGWAATAFDRNTEWCVGEVVGRNDIERVTGLVDVCRNVWGEVDQEMGDLFLVAFEDFILRQVTSDRALLSPVRLTAAFRDRMRDFRYPFYRCSTSDAKHVVTDTRLRGWNMYAEGPDHVRDALRVAVMGARQFAGDFNFQRYVKDLQWDDPDKDGDEEEEEGL